MTDPRCPKCGRDCVLIEETVDIGVGTQAHTLGWDCISCGQISCCTECGQPEDNHTTWCKEAQ